MCCFEGIDESANLYFRVAAQLGQWRSVSHSGIGLNRLGQLK